MKFWSKLTYTGIGAALVLVGMIANSFVPPVASIDLDKQMAKSEAILADEIVGNFDVTCKNLRVRDTVTIGDTFVLTTDENGVFSLKKRMDFKRWLSRL